MTDQAEERALESIGNERANQALTPTLVRPDFDCPVAHVAAGTDSTLVVDRDGTLMASQAASPPCDHHGRKLPPPGRVVFTTPPP